MSFKKLFYCAFYVAIISFAVKAEMNPNAIGLRFGYFNATGGFAEVSYQRFLGDLSEDKIWSERVEVDLGTKSLSVSGQFHRIVSESINFYLGIGTFLGWNRKDESAYWGLGGPIGVEYKFDNLPVTMSLDFRPMYNLFNYLFREIEEEEDATNTNITNPFVYGIGLGVRYMF
jgi:hypothetical protein